jgi:TetR/AcrR family hemagglutinin/protease transcriptional regulator
MVFDPDGKPSGMEEMISRGFDHILGVKSRA